MKMNQDSKNGIRRLIYFSCILISAIYIMFYIDSNYFHNVTKIRYSLKMVYITDFKSVMEYIKHDNYFKSKLIVKDGNPYLLINNFKDVIINDSNKNILDKNGLHPTQSLALFSMGFLSDYFIESYKSNTLKGEKLKLIEDTYLFIYSEISNPFSLNPMVINDHVVSERVQFVAIFLSYIRENYPENKELLNALSKDLNICYNLILDREFFTWNTNHGIMQLRSYGQLLSITKDNKKKVKVKEFESRLNDIIPFYLGEDGAVYESATGYWYYIYKQLKKITENSSLQNLESVNVLKLKLNNSKFFLNCVSSNDFYVEGIGDSYSYYLDSLDMMEINENRFFNFSNNISGANWCNNNKNINVLFSSLFTPPNVHKLPDDLMFSLYINSPFFTNTGIYSYDQSKERVYFKSDENAHSSVLLISENKMQSDSSFVKLTSYDSISSSVNLFGVKYYPNSQKVFRKINIKPKVGIITIRDSTMENNKIKTSFNIHPETRVQKISDKICILTNKDSIKIKLSSNHIINIKKTIISTQKEKIDTINKLEINGNVIVTNISFKSSTRELEKFKLYNSSYSKNTRLEQSVVLAQKYNYPRRDGFKSVLLTHFYLLGIILAVIVFIIEISFKIYK